MATRKRSSKKETKTEELKTLKPGDAVEYNGAEYKIVQLFGPAERYAVIENRLKRFSVEAKTLTASARQ